MASKARILYIQHAGALGGSARSLSLTIKNLDGTRYEPVVLCIRDAHGVLSLFSSMGIEVNVADGISTFEHTTLRWYKLYNPIDLLRLLGEVWNYMPSIKKTKEIIDGKAPDIVHLNSLVLSPSAWGAKRAGARLVWHVREPVARGHFGLRKRVLRAMVRKLSDETIFISKNDQETLLSKHEGIVVPNFVENRIFNTDINVTEARKKIGLGIEDKVVLFLGGVSVVKGIFPLLKALPTVQKEIARTHCLLAGALYEHSNRLAFRAARMIMPMLGYGTVSQRVDKIIEDKRMQGFVHLLPWHHDVENLIAACDVLAFPSIEPHFARPVIEAGAMGKPVVASRIGGVEELVEDGVTGILVPPGDPRALADALIKVLSDNAMAKRMGEAGRKRAEERYSSRNVRMIEEVYERLLKDG